MLRPTNIILFSSLILLLLVMSIALNTDFPTKNTVKLSPEENQEQIYKFSPTQAKLPLLLITSVFVLGVVALTILKRAPKQI